MASDAEAQYMVQQWEEGKESHEGMMAVMQSRINCIAIGEMLKGF